MRLKKEISGKWLGLWAARAEESASSLEHSTNLGYMNLYRWLRGERACNDTNLVTLISTLYKRGIPEPGELHYALHEMQISPSHFESLLNLSIPHKALLKWLNGWQKHYVGLNQRPPLPSVYVERPEELTQLKGNLLREPESGSVIIWGMAGSGKTTLARVVVEDPDIQQAFWSGVLWAALGPEAAPRSWLYRWCVSLGIIITPSAEIELMREQLVAKMTQPGKRYLVIVDDVWDHTHLQGLLLPIGNLKWLFTTRDRTLITHFPSGQIMEVGAMKKQESRTLLNQLIGVEQLACEPESAGDELIQLVERMPLAVKLLGNLVRLRGWAYVLPAVRNERTRLLMLAEGGALTRETSMRLALQVSYAALPTALQEYFRRLGVFGYGNDFSGVMTANLWGPVREGMNVTELQILADKQLWYLYDVGLLELAVVEQTAPRFHLHTLVHDYARLLLREVGEFDVERGKYVVIYMRWAFLASSLLALLEEEWQNLQVAFAYACELAMYEEGTSLLACVHSFMAVRMDFRSWDAWLERLEPVWTDLSPTAQGMWDHAKARRLYTSGRWQEAQFYRRRFLKTPRSEKRLKAALCIQEADSCWRHQEWTAAEQALSEAESYIGNTDVALEREYVQLAIRFAHHHGNLKYVQETLPVLALLSSLEQDPIRQGGDLLQRAELYRDIGEINRAKECLHHALEIAQRYKVAALEYSVLLEMIQLYLQIEQFSDALRFGARSLELLERWPEGMEAFERGAFVYQLLTAACIEQNDLQQALQYAQTALPLATATGDPMFLGRNFMLMGQAQEKRGDIAAAVTSYSIAKRYWGAVPDPSALLHGVDEALRRCHR